MICKNRLPFTSAALSFLFIVTSLYGASLQENEQKNLQVRPFPLQQVRLLPGIFKHAQDLSGESLLRYEPDRLLAKYRLSSGLQAKAPHYEGWEGQGVAGHCLGHYLSALSLMYASTGDDHYLKRVNTIIDELDECQKANGDGYLMAIPRGKELFAEIAAGKITTQRFDLNGGWVPLYTLHKELAGLRDAWRICGNKKALAIERQLAGWLGKIVSGLKDEQMQKIMFCEHGGTNETLADLAWDTGEQKYMDLALRFHHQEVLDPMMAGNDVLPGMHANTQIPKIIGLARIAELTDDASRRQGAEFFWDRVVNHHSYVTGGHCINEHFGQPDRLNDRLGVNTTETCNVYNMLKLTNHLFCWNPRGNVADFYERALYNHILSSQHPVDGRVIYNLTLEMGGSKNYQDPFGFTCCVGSGMENHSKYGESIYFHNDNNLYVNLFIASELNWKDKQLRLTQETRYPEEDATRFTIKAGKPTLFTLNLRHPYWARQGVEIKINGQPQTIASTPGAFIALNRTWKEGDQVEFRLPMSLRLESMPDNPNRVAIMYGPLVLAGQLGEVNSPDAKKSDFVPVLITNGKPLQDWVKPVAGKPLTFTLSGAGRPRDVTLQPFYATHDLRYTIYWDIFTEEDWNKQQAKYEAIRQQELKLAARTLDFIQPGEQQPEKDHNLQHNNSSSGSGPQDRKWRHAPNGWFSYDVKVDEKLTQVLQVTYWGDDRDRVFDIRVDETNLAQQKLTAAHPGKYFTVDYPIPANLIKGKTKVTVKFAAQPNSTAGGVFGVRILKTE